MNLPDDLKNYRAAPEEDALQILTPDLCVVLLCALAVVALIFWPYL